MGNGKEISPWSPHCLFPPTCLAYSFGWLEAGDPEDDDEAEKRLGYAFALLRVEPLALRVVSERTEPAIITANNDNNKPPQDHHVQRQQFIERSRFEREYQICAEGDDSSSCRG